MKIYFLAAASFICCAAYTAEKSFQDKLSILIEKNPQVPALNKREAIKEIVSNPVYFCDINPEDAMRDHLAQRLRYNHTTLADAEPDTLIRHALVTEYLKHNKRSLFCCGPALPYKKQTASVCTCFICYTCCMAHCPNAFNIDLPGHPELPGTAATLLSLFASRLTCMLAEVCCTSFLHESKREF